MKIGIMTAMDQEYEMASRVLKGNSRHDIIPVHCGWGKVNSAVNAYRLIAEHNPDCIISTGCAGGIAADVHLLDVVVAAQVAYHDCWYGEPNEYGQVQGFPARFDADPTLLAAAKRLVAGKPSAPGRWAGRSTPKTGSISGTPDFDPQGANHPGIARPKANAAGKLHFGLMASGDRFVSGKADTAAVLAHFPDALACDMESGSISQVCKMFVVPFLSIRVISDTANEDDRLGQFENFWDTVGSESFEILRSFINEL